MADDNGHAQMERRNGGSMPVPDPTALTSAALAREIKALKELLELLIAGERDARLAADMVLGNTVDLQEQLRSEKFSTVAEKFGAVTREMQLVENSRIEQKQDALASLAAALSAAKEAVKEQTTASALSIAKSENATHEQLQQLTVTFTTAIEGVNRTIDDLKERVSKGEQSLAAHSAGQTGEAKGSSAILAYLFAAAATIIAVVSIIVQLSH